MPEPTPDTADAVAAVDQMLALTQRHRRDRDPVAGICDELLEIRAALVP